MSNSEYESFEQFMARALHHPVHGYYQQNIKTVGRAGDFSTSATLLPEVAQGISQWILTNKIHTSPSTKKSKIHVIEIGAGTGASMQQVLDHLGWWKRRTFQFHSMETSPVLQQEQKRNLKKYRVQWHTDMSQAVAACQGQALIYSNELVDAFPCRIFGFQERAWCELFLQRKEKEISECWLPMGTKEYEVLADQLQLICPQPCAGQRLEIPFAYRDWLGSWVKDWRSGSMLTIDYGASAEQLSRRYRYGSMRAYYKHMRLEGDEIYRRVGKQDLTYDINFTLLEQWGKEHGLRTVSNESLGKFLLKQGLTSQPNSNAMEAAHQFQLLEQERA